MKVFLAGGSGAIGKRLVPMLVANGHQVVATTTSERKLPALRELGAEAVVLDVLDRNAVMATVMRSDPDVVIHQATALSAMGASLRNLDKVFARTNRLRTEGTDNLLEGIRLALSGHHWKLVEHTEFHRRSSLYAPSAVVMRGYFFASA